MRKGSEKGEIGISMDGSGTLSLALSLSLSLLHLWRVRSGGDLTIYRDPLNL